MMPGNGSRLKGGIFSPCLQFFQVRFKGGYYYCGIGKKLFAAYNFILRINLYG
jgi:hypothetical protein